MARYEIYPLEADDLCRALGIERSLTVKEREDIDDNDFAWPDAPDHPKYPINTQAHLDAASKLIGRAPADKQASIKARAIKIAKRKGFKLPDSWQDEEKDDKERSMGTEHIHEALTRAISADHEPMTTTHTHSHPAFGSQGDDDSHEHEHTHNNDNNHDHKHTERAVGSNAAITPESLSLYAPIVRTDANEWIVEGQVTSDQIDYYGTIFDYEASKEAFRTWRGNIREQHDSKKAVGRAIEVIPDDATHTIFLRAHISKGAKDTWEKILDGTLSGFSVNADPRHVETSSIMRNGKNIPVYRVKKWAEVSVVDNPGSPGCDCAPLVRADGVLTDIIDTSEEETTAPIESVATSSSLERAGARVSSETKSAMHTGIGHTLKAAVSQMKNCGCDDCQAAMKMIDPDDDGDVDMGGYDDPDNDWQSLYGQNDEDTERALTGLVERILDQRLAPVYTRLQGIAGTLARSNATSSLETIVASAITRAVEAASSANEASRSKVDADLSALKETVARIENTPVPGAPVMNASAMPRPALNKRLPTDPEYAPPKSTGSAVADAMRQLAEAGYLNTEQRQVDALAAGLILQQQGGR